jgi:hypothetical protein
MLEQSLRRLTGDREQLRANPSAEMRELGLPGRFDWLKLPDGPVKSIDLATVHCLIRGRNAWQGWSRRYRGGHAYFAGFEAAAQAAESQRTQGSHFQIVEEVAVVAVAGELALYFVDWRGRDVLAPALEIGDPTGLRGLIAPVVRSFGVKPLATFKGDVPALRIPLWLWDSETLGSGTPLRWFRRGEPPTSRRDVESAHLLCGVIRAHFAP